MPEFFSLDNPLAIIGDEDIVLGFKALGFKIYALQEQREFDTIIDRVVGDNAAICLVQDEFYRTNKSGIEKYNKMPLPIFIPFSKSIPSDLLDGMVKNIRLRATGKL